MGQEVIGQDGPETINLKDALEERYLSYALTTIMHRALPDVRDGLKPVHRRILYGMRLLKLDPNQGFKKCARVVGDVMGKYHPHGDAAIYDALVRLAQDFSVRYPMVDGQGNFGNIDGDSAAAMRYTEARMTDVATRILDGLNENAVDFRETYDGLDSEPVVLPGSFPNLLANGSTGIAVGMATSIPPHNAHELCNACQLLISKPDAEVEELLEHIKGPDFPTGGTIVNDKGSILEAYKTGRGSFRTRAKWHKEEGQRGTYNIVVTEIPYLVQKSRLIEKIAELLMARKLPLLDDIRDESAEDVRVVLVPRNKNVDPELLMASLFKLTDLENRFSLNMNVLSKGVVPKVMSLKEVLQEWLEHQKEVLVRRSNHRLDQINHRLEVLEGYLVAYLNIDEVIRIIREEDDAKASLIKAFDLTEVQAEAILNMRLRSLRKLEEFEIKKEHDKLSKEKAGLEALLASDKKQWNRVSKQVGEIGKAYGPETEIGARRTDFGTADDRDLEEINQAMIEKEPITVVISEKGWIRTLKGHVQDVTNLAFKQGDQLHLSFHAETTSKILIFTSGGKFYTLGADKLPGGRGHGEPIRLMLDMDETQEIISAFVHDPERKLLMSTDGAYGFVVQEKDVIANTRKGKQVLNVTAPAKAVLCVPAIGDYVAVIGHNRKLLTFPLAQIAVMTRGRGVRLQRYRDGGISDIKTFDSEEGLTWTDASGRIFKRTLEEMQDWRGDRGQAGRLPPNGFPRTNKFDGSSTG
ncbi:DNA topoisomerase IV subunit A [Pseudovibrio sp. JE062]|uniref:DNA topoisomerase IV subunit A n=1 Tax=Pseudovibrio sp. JE062 TaxID=439495 RepID=UPI000186C6F9|nr:DNA topoisomerase IV subunit A [Pseudovibrio sp. JE062]EEA96989.1 DNA topoisomerase IV, A subunit [Pseudovibrio sp. JE062]